MGWGLMSTGSEVGAAAEAAGRMFAAKHWYTLVCLTTVQVVKKISAS